MNDVTKKIDIKELRKINGLTVKELSEKSGIPIRTIEDIEKNGTCKITTALKLASALDTSVDYLALNTDYKGFYAGIDFHQVLNTILPYFENVEDIKTMFLEVNTYKNQMHIKAMNQAYEIYENIINSPTPKKQRWTSVK